MDAEELYETLLSMARDGEDFDLVSFLSRKKRDVLPMLEAFLESMEDDDSEEEDDSSEEELIHPEEPIAASFSPEEEAEILEWIKAKALELLASGKFSNPRRNGRVPMADRYAW